jgi:acetate kinase
MAVNGNSNPYVLTLNAGSSSIKFTFFETSEAPRWLVEGVIENIGQDNVTFSVQSEDVTDNFSKKIVASNHSMAIQVLVTYLKEQASRYPLSAVGHRIVHGGPKYYTPCLVDDALLTDLRAFTLFDPEHLPAELHLIETVRDTFPDVVQVACFDTAFHHDLPIEARLLPIPRRYEKQGLRRYGFHGLSYEFIMTELEEKEGAGVAKGRIILAHLGSGASLAAVSQGKSVDTTMGLTPAAGIPMSTRSGDIDPGLSFYLANSEGMGAEAFSQMMNFESGLLGISGMTSSMKELLQEEDTVLRAREAVDLFCYQVKKSIGGLAAGLGGLDTLVFTGGIGEQAPNVREKICQGLQFLGIELDGKRNMRGDRIISQSSGKVKVYVIHTDEAVTIARAVTRFVNK